MNAPAPSAAERRWLVTAALLATYLQAVMISLPNAVVLRVEGAMAMADDEIGWVFSAYIAASAVVMPMTGWLAGRFGRKRVMQTSLLLFGLGLALATQAATMPQFIAARIVEGAASGPIAPLSVAILLGVTPPERHARISLIATVTVLLGILSGPALGGWISEDRDWRIGFYCAVPLTALVIALFAATLREAKPAQAPAFDLFGLASVSLGMIGLQMLLDRGERVEWFASTESCLEAGASALGFGLYAVHALTSERHFIDKRLFQDRNFVLATVMFFAFGFVLLPTLALTSPMLEELLGYPDDTTGVMTIPRGLALIGGLLLGGRLARAIDIRLLVLGGIALTAYGNARMLGYSPLMDWQPVVVAGAIQGAGLGIVMAALARAAFSTLAPQLRAEGTALFNLARLYGSTLGIAVVQIYLYDNTQMVHLALAANLTGHQVPTRLGGLFAGAGLATLNDMITGQAALIGVIDQFKLLMFAILAVSPLALLLRVPRQPAQS